MAGLAPMNPEKALSVLAGWRGAMTAIVKEVRAASEPDGSHCIEVELADGQRVLATIPADRVQSLQSRLQTAVIQRAFDQVQRGTGSAPGASLPSWSISEANVAHNGRETSLSVTTSQVGTFALHGNLNAWREMRAAIDQIIVAAGVPASTH